MTDTSLSEALKEAYASAPANTIIYSTIEMWHSAFTTPIRVVRAYTDITAQLESTAPRDPGAIVTFVAFSFDITRPEVVSDSIPQITITIDNVSREVLANIEKTIGTYETIKIIYREYIGIDGNTSNLGQGYGPENNPPIELTVLGITADVHKITATAGFPNLNNKKFPTTAYDSTVFTGLSI